MNILATGRSLVLLTRELSLKWEQTNAAWHDSKSQEFEQRYLAELWGSVDRALPVLEQLEKLLTQVRSDCE